MLPPFSAATARQDRFFDGVARSALLLTAVLLGFIALSSGAALMTVLGVGLVAVLLLGQGLRNARMVRQAQLMRAMLTAGAIPLGAASQRLEALRRRRGVNPLVRHLTELAWAQLAELRQNPAEAAAIARHLLGRRLGPLEASRPDLLLILGRASVDCRDLSGSWAAVLTLRHTPLPLMQRFDALSLEVHHRLLAGDDAGLVRDLPQFLDAAEPMPAPKSATLHAMLARAVERSQRSGAPGLEELRAWLDARLAMLMPDGYQAFLSARGLAPRPAAPGG